MSEDRRENGVPRLEPGADQSDCGIQIAKHELSAHMDDAEAQAAELAIAASIRASLTRMNGAIHFDDELNAWCAEVSDELAADRHLATEGHAELPGLERGPEARFRLGEAAAMLTSEQLKALSKLEIERLPTRMLSLQRRQRAGRSLHGAGCVTRPRRVTRAMTGAARSVRPLAKPGTLSVLEASVGVQ